ncbi:MAG: hypothetical protein NC122_04160 [Faecalibacterium sp.]|nr:hypothetical protein [Ruminococcus sp.]MCM1392932.1 hypothetical protein [Ruminococcus sp.]MCM1485378.1 hypothetical protein [Faecalibacterium sp.]
MKDRKNLKLLISIAIVIIVSAFILSHISVLVKDKFSDTRFLDRQNIEEFYSLDKDTVDVLAIGTSQVLSGFAAPELYLNYGIAAYGLGTCNQPLLGSYYWLLEALKTQSPKVVMLEMAALYGQREQVEEQAFFKAVSLMKNTSKYKLEAVNSISEVIEGTDKISYYSDLYKFHSRWSDIGKTDYAFLQDFKRPTFGGTAVLNETLTETVNINDYFVNAVDTATQMENDMSITYLEKIAQLCKDNGIELILFKTPKVDWSSEDHTGVLQYAEKFDVSFVDFNVKEQFDELALNLTNDFSDPNHLNATGAKKLTDSIGKYLIENYDFDDRRNDEKYNSYDRIAKDYTQALNSAMITRSNDISEILSLSQDQNYSILIAKDGNVDSSKIDEQIRALGFSGSLSDGKNVLLVFENGKLIKQTVSENNITMSKYFSDKNNYQIRHKGLKTTVEIFGSSYTVTDTEDYVAVCIYDNVAKYSVYTNAFDADLNKIEIIEE